MGSSTVLTNVTNNATNMVKAFSLPEFETIAEESASSSSEEEDDIDSNIIVAPEEYKQLLFCHAIQLVVSDEFKEAGQLNRVLAKSPRSSTTYINRQLQLTRGTSEDAGRKYNKVE